MADAVDPSVMVASFQRELNRANDSDRSTRKRGLQKLLEDVPWGKKSQREALKFFVSQSLLKVLIPLIADEVEKCRELTLQILKKCIEKCDDISAAQLHELVVNLSARVGEVPFAEPAEEIRLLVVELLTAVKKHATLTAGTSLPTETEQVLVAIDEKIAQTLVKALTDGFPSVKRAGAELLIEVTRSSPNTVKSYYKALLKALAGNSAHQHSKTRAITLQAMGEGLNCLGLEEYVNLLKEPILAIFLRTVSDRTASVRMELGNVCVNIVTHRTKQCLSYQTPLLSEDFELFAVLLLLHGDVIEEVAAEGRRQLIRAVHLWDETLLKPASEEEDVPIHHSGMDVEDGEAALQSHAAHAQGAAVTAQASPAVPIDYDNVDKVKAFVSANLLSLMRILHEGVESWTTDSRKRYLRALDRLIGYTDARISTVLPRVLSLLAPAVRDEDAEVRAAAEACCVRLGAQAVPEEILEILLPRVEGAVAGGDTAAQRANAIGVLTHVMHGVRQREGANGAYLCTTIASSLADTSLYAYREASLREALLLLVRVIVECFPEECKSSTHIQGALLLALVFLCGKCPGEDDVISDIAHKELRRLSAVCAGSDAPGALLGAHYSFVLYQIISFQLPAEAKLPATIDAADPKNAQRMAQYYETVGLAWEADSAAMAAFGVLVREAPFASWEKHALVLPIVRKLVQPKAAPAAGSVEANMLSYAAQRGEDVPNASIGLVDARLHLLALLEGMVRAGTANWECSQHIAAASAVIIRHIVVPNLVWRVGRVEATVRKVALALCYGILKAGAVPTETLFSTAAELVPLVVSHLDDSEVTPRQMACLCVTVLFERLRGVFSEQSVHEIYPKLVARLDDSNDQVRVAICGALVMFFQAGAHPKCFSHTTVDYTLDQLFIHLDDPDPKIQQAVLQAIAQVAASLDREAVLRKAEKNRTCHRTPAMCDKVVFEVTGVEILED